VQVFLTAKVRTTKTPVLDVGQVVHVVRVPWDANRCSVDPSDLTFVSRSKLAERVETAAESVRAPDCGSGE
jgi:hypothetical protein